MADRVEVDLIVKAITQGFDKVGKDFKTIDQEQRKSAGAAQLLKDNWLKMAAAAGTVAIGIRSLKELWDFGKEGAEIVQMGESWEMLLDKVGGAPDLLGQLQEASRGTIDDFSLMTSTATLLAGASGELGTALADATPELLEIAKAANKLNPALGDTAFLYESIATGIKRASPMILDNLGLTIKVGAANEAMALKLGKTVDQLTAEEKSMAILNDTMRAGMVLIDQVGGNVDAMGDSFARLETAVTNISNEIKAKFAPALADAAEAGFTLLTWNEQIAAAMASHEVEVRETTTSYEDYVAEMERSAEAAGKVARTQEEVDKMMRIGGEAANVAADAFIILSSAGWDADAAVRAAAEAIEEAGKSGETAAEQIGAVAHALTEVTQAEIAREALANLNEIQEDISQADYDLMYREIAVNILGMSQGAVTARLTLDKLKKMQDDGDLSLEDYLETLRLFNLGLSGLPKEKTIRIHTIYSTTGKGYQAQQSGGPLAPIALVGEAGPELIIGGVVIPADQTRRILALGLRPDRKMQYGGSMLYETFETEAAAPTFGYTQPQDVLAWERQTTPTRRPPRATTAGLAPAVTGAPAPAVSDPVQIAQITAEQVSAGVASTLATTQAEQIVALKSTLLEQTRETKKQLTLLTRIESAIIDQGTMEDLGDIMVVAEE